MHVQCNFVAIWSILWLEFSSQSDIQPLLFANKFTSDSAQYSSCFCYCSLQFSTVQSSLLFYQILGFSWNWTISKFNQLEVICEHTLNLIFIAICSLFWLEFSSEIDIQPFPFCKQIHLKFSSISPCFCFCSLQFSTVQTYLHLFTYWPFPVS